MSIPRWSCLGAGALLASLAACGHVPTPKSTAQLRSDEYDAAYRIAEARCDRQTPACETASGAHYASRDACIQAKLFASAMETEMPSCKEQVIDESDLDACIAQIHQNACGTGVRGIDACRPKKLCPYRAEEGTVQREGPTDPNALASNGARDATL